VLLAGVGIPDMLRLRRPSRQILLQLEVLPKAALALSAGIRIVEAHPWHVAGLGVSIVVGARPRDRRPLGSASASLLCLPRARTERRLTSAAIFTRRAADPFVQRWRREMHW